MSLLFIAILAGLGGMLGWGFSEFATKISVDRIGTLSSLVWAHVYGTLLLLAVVFMRPIITGSTVSLPNSALEWVGLFFFGALQAAVYYFAYKGFEKGQVSILSPIFSSFAGLVALISIVFLGETLNFHVIPALILIFGGVLLINLDLKSLRHWHLQIRGVPGLFEILIATVLATIWTLGWDTFTTNGDWLIYTTLMFAFMTIAAYFLAYINKVRLFDSQRNVWMPLWLIAIGEVVAYLAITIGYSSTSYTSVVAILSGASSLPTILLAQIFLKEKMTHVQILACATIIIGIMLLSLR